jgi:anthranilate synthase/aminodeoxychorismate synthase-like glutamine amidotransferase
VTVLVVDNYDSFTYNLVQLLGALGARPIVARNDAITLADVRRLDPTHIVLSPGPGNPMDPVRVGICPALVTALGAEIPILGVCLGHQAIVSALGGRVVRAREVVHGKTSAIHHDGDAILADLPRPFEAMRYHSLVCDRRSIPPCLAVTAWCKDGSVMAVRHARHPIFGVQFHPESVGTPCGRLLVEAFLRVPLPMHVREPRVGPKARAGQMGDQA